MSKPRSLQNVQFAVVPREARRPLGAMSCRATLVIAVKARAKLEFAHAAS